MGIGVSLYFQFLKVNSLDVNTLMLASIFCTISVFSGILSGCSVDVWLMFGWLFYSRRLGFGDGRMRIRATGDVYLERVPHKSQRSLPLFKAYRWPIQLHIPTTPVHTTCYPPQANNVRSCWIYARQQGSSLGNNKIVLAPDRRFPHVSCSILPRASYHPYKHESRILAAAPFVSHLTADFDRSTIFVLLLNNRPVSDGDVLRPHDIERSAPAFCRFWRGFHRGAVQCLALERLRQTYDVP